MTRVGCSAKLGGRFVWSRRADLEQGGPDECPSCQGATGGAGKRYCGALPAFGFHPKPKTRRPRLLLQRYGVANDLYGALIALPRT